MYKDFKKFLTIFMVSLMWTQLGYAPEGEGFEGVDANHFDISGKTPDQIEALKQEARERLGLKDIPDLPNTYNQFEEKKAAIDEATEEHIKNTPEKRTPIINPAFLLKRDVINQQKTKSRSSRSCGSSTSSINKRDTIFRFR